MKVKAIIDEDFTNYKKPSMFIGTASCGGKCCMEAGIPISVCQNDGWRSRAAVVIPDYKIIERYLSNPITSAICFGGLEPFEQFNELESFLYALRGDFECYDDVVIYTGYYPAEIVEKLLRLRRFTNIIIKFGRYKPNIKSRFDNVLGVTLISDNQYAERIS